MVRCISFSHSEFSEGFEGARLTWNIKETQSAYGFMSIQLENEEIKLYICI